MTRYHYSAARGKEIETGQIEAPDPRLAFVLIRNMGLTPISVDPAKSPSTARKKGTSGLSLFGPKKVTDRQITFVTRQLATLLVSGLPLARALSFVSSQTASPALAGLIQAVRDKIQGGATLSEALAEHPRQFDALYLSMIRAGESAGILDTILDRLARMRESREELAGKVRGALIYPAFMFFAMAGCIGVLMGVVVPRFAMLFSDMGQALPLPTLILMGAARGIKLAWWILPLIGAAAFAGYKHVIRTPRGAVKMDQAKLNLPGIGSFLLTASMARFCRTLGTLLASGVPLLGALGSASGVSGNRAVQEAVERVAQSVKQGEPLGRLMDETGVFPQYVVEMATMGEESATLDTMMIKVAETYDREVDQLVKSLTAMVEPLMILCMGGVVGFIVMAMLFPIFQMNLMAG